MNTNRKIVSLVITLGSVVALSAWSSASPVRIAPESKLWVEGTSNVRSFTCSAALLEGQVEGGPAATSLAIPNLERAIRTLDLRIPVQSLDCANGTMNSHMRKALKGDEQPAIAYHLLHYEARPNGSEGANITLYGRLTIAGQAKPVTMEVTAATLDNGALRVQGSQDIVMTEYGVKPPSLMLGTMRVHDLVKVRFDVVLRP